MAHPQRPRRLRLEPESLLYAALVPWHDAARHDGDHALARVPGNSRDDGYRALHFGVAIGESRDGAGAVLRRVDEFGRFGFQSGWEGPF